MWQELSALLELRLRISSTSRPPETMHRRMINKVIQEDVLYLLIFKLLTEEETQDLFAHVENAMEHCEITAPSQ